MDLQLPLVPILLSLFLFLFMALNIFKKSHKNSSKLPPGPWKLPIIGNLHQLAGSLPHHALRDLANKFGPLMSIRLGQLRIVVVSSPDMAKEVMRTHDAVFAFRPRVLVSEIMFYNSTDIAFSPSGEYWRQLRKICTQEILSPGRVQSFRPIREEEMFNLVDWVRSNVGSSVNMTERIYSTNYAVTSRAAFGRRSANLEEFISIVMEAVGILGGFDLADLFPSLGFLDPLIFGTRAKLMRLHLRVDQIFEEMIKEHMEKRREKEKERESDESEDDLVDVLLKFHGKDQLGFSLTSDHIKAVIWDVFSGGSETSATATDWAMVEMMKNPRVMKKAQAEVREVFSRKGSVDETSISEMKYLECVVKETLRLHPPAPLLLPRESREKCEINGYEIPKKTRVIINAWAMGRDPQSWVDPESFMPERFLDSSVDFKGKNFEYIPFGAGRRICPGMSYGIINVELPLAMLLYHFDWQLPNGMKHHDLDMTELFGVTVKRKQDLNLIPLPPNSVNMTEKIQSY